MKKYFIELCWKNEDIPYFHFKDYETKADEFFYIPEKLIFKKNNKKICIGTLNPYTREYISCNKKVEENEFQCNKCKYLFDFYKCVRCHGENCLVKNQDVLKYCQSPHYVYLAYFPNKKIKVGTASEIKKYNRLLEQGALFSIFIAKTPSGKIARKIEKSIIDSGVLGSITTLYKMKNILYDESTILIKKILLEKYKDIIKYVSDENIKYLLEPQENFFNNINKKIQEHMISDDVQFNLFEAEPKIIKKYIIQKTAADINGDFLYAVGKIIAVKEKDEIKIIDTRKMEGFLYEIENMEHFKQYNENNVSRRK